MTGACRIAGRLFALCPLLGLAACGWIHAPVLDPKGPVALAERDLLLTAFGLMLIVLVPVYGLTVWILRTYRATAATDRAGYMPNWSYSIWIDIVIWAVPAAIIFTLGTIVWNWTHRLDPYRALAAPGPPLEVQVVAQDWKWLFIYPGSGVATVNELVFPSGRPLRLRITSDTVMNSFYIAGLGGQIYAMAGMESQLNLLADQPATLRGRNTMYSGEGFADQNFAVRATSAEEFEAWIAKVKTSPDTLDADAYAALVKPSQRVAPILYSTVEDGLFAGIIAKYRAVPHPGYRGEAAQGAHAGHGG